MDKKIGIYVTGSNGFVGSNLIKQLKKSGYENVITSNHDLSSQNCCDEFFRTNEIEWVFHTGSKVGGIAANIQDPMNFLLQNLKITTSVFETAIKYRVKRFLNLSSSCVFPKNYPVQPMTEECLMKGVLEESNEGYALAKICALKLGEYANKQTQTNFITLSPCNLYGPGDHIGSPHAHALASIIFKVGECLRTGQSEVLVWGTGAARREWLFVEDLTEAMIFAMEKNLNDTPFYNVGYGTDVDMNTLTEIIINKYEKIIGTPGTGLKIVNVANRPEGTLRKLVDSSKINAKGWVPSTSLELGIEKTIKAYLANVN